MPVFKPVVRDIGATKPVPVYIRITHNRKVAYIKTDKLAMPRKSADGGFDDVFVSRYCAEQIVEYTEALNREDISKWSVGDIKCFLQERQRTMSFTDFAEQYIDRMVDRGQLGNAHVYRVALKSLKEYMGQSRVEFVDMTRANLLGWIDNLADTTKRAKRLYPVSIRNIYRKAYLLSLDSRSGIGKIAGDPWLEIDIPESGKGDKRAISAEACRVFFGAPVGADKKRSWRERLGRDVAMISLCLAGMNSVDLYGLKKQNYVDGVIRYRRTKTSRRRSDNAYFEIKVPELVKPLIEMYKATEGSDSLFCFSEKYADAKAFNVVVNQGIKIMCKQLEIPPQDYYSLYTFRHTWATTAQNDCGATLSDVGFALNHSGALPVTRGYVDIDFTPAWELNAKVIDFIFFSTAESKKVAKQNRVVSSGNEEFCVSEKAMVYARAYFRGEVLAEVSDIGFGNVDGVIAALAAKLPGTLPQGCAVQFRIKNVDTDREVVYERTKGKGF